ncbi:MAG TPA: hypothetical protein H9829_01095, partial [Candidatus Tetragenococcus pullicola]|nr:hypothetical protein [Candidatus Tetragenococcus pullicola]
TTNKKTFIFIPTKNNPFDGRRLIPSCQSLSSYTYELFAWFSALLLHSYELFGRFPALLSLTYEFFT